MNSFRLEREIINGSSTSDIVVKIKGGLSYIIKRRSEADYDTSGDIVLLRMNGVTPNCIQFDPDHATTKFDKYVMSQFKERLETETSRSGYFTGMTVNLVVHVKLSGEVAEEGGFIHSEMLGMTLYRGRGYLTHQPLNVPKATLGGILSALKDSTGNKRMAYYCAYVNDPQNTQHPYYVNLGGKATEVPVEHDESIQPGLYVGVDSGNTSPDILFYSFDGLDKDTLERLGIFMNKAEALKGGNTERYVEAESKIKDLSKALERKSDELREAQVKLSRLEEQLKEVNTQVTFMKQDHKNALEKLRMDAAAAAHKSSRSEINNKEESDRNKFEMRNREFYAKITLDQTRKQNNLSGWGELLKGVGSLVGIFLTGFKLLFN